MGISTWALHAFMPTPNVVRMNGDTRGSTMVACLFVRRFIQINDFTTCCTVFAIERAPVGDSMLKNIGRASPIRQSFPGSLVSAVNDNENEKKRSTDATTQWARRYAAGGGCGVSCRGLHRACYM